MFCYFGGCPVEATTREGTPHACNLSQMEEPAVTGFLSVPNMYNTLFCRDSPCSHSRYQLSSSKHTHAYQMAPRSGSKTQTLYALHELLPELARDLGTGNKQQCMEQSSAHPQSVRGIDLLRYKVVAPAVFTQPRNVTFQSPSDRVRYAVASCQLQVCWLQPVDG